MPALIARSEGTSPLPALSDQALTESERVTEGQHNKIKYPRFTRGFLWKLRSDSRYLTPSASATEHVPPLPAPPDSILRDPDTVYTLTHFPDLFKVVTPINVKRFSSLLDSHPNCPFVDSVVRGLTDGFWPLADDDPELYPSA
jgi:hypothetical protein